MSETKQIAPGVTRRDLPWGQIFEGKKDALIALEAESKITLAVATGNLEKAKEARAELLKIVEEFQARGETTLARQFGESANAGFEAAVRQHKLLTQSIAEASKIGADLAVGHAKDAFEKIKELSQQEVSRIDLRVGLNLESFGDVITKLREAFDKETFQVNVQAKIGTGEIDFNPPQLSAGGLIQRLAGGGSIRGPGGPTGDRIPALLSDGEFVMRSAAVRNYGYDFMRMLNQMALPKFASGGAVGSAPAGKAMDTVRVELSVRGKTHELYGEHERVRQLVNDLAVIGLGVAD
jgi:hypothetical protein